MVLKGKGFFIWKIPNVESGDAGLIAAQAKASGLTHVLIKIADGTYSSNYDNTRRVDLIPPVAQALKAHGIQVWGWHYVYGADPLGEARKAIQRIRDLNLEGYVIDAEAEYKKAGRNIAAQKFMSAMRAAFPSLPMALSSYRFPSYHRELPWHDFLEKCDLNMPQVYWEQAHNPGSQLARSVKEFQSLSPYRPVIPTGPTYKVNGWAPTQSDIIQFMDTARNLNLTAVNFFSWDECRRDLPGLWNTIRDYAWTGASLPEEIPNQLMAALNSHDPKKVANLYSTNAIHITSARTTQGPSSISAWYGNLLNQMLPDARFTLTSLSGQGNSRQFTWKATSSRGNINNGSDSIGLIDGKISYHYTYFSISHN